MLATSPLENLINLSETADSAERRAVLREVTEAMMAAPDRYGRREMSVFDLLLSRTANEIDRRLRRVLTLALIRAGAREEHTKLALKDLPSPNETFLRRSATQTKRDLLSLLMEKSRNAEIPAATAEDTGNALALPDHFLLWLYQYQLTHYAGALTPKIGADRAEIMYRTALRAREALLATATEAAREEIVVARRTIRDWTRRRCVTEDLLSDLLESRAMTEFTFALMALFEVDTATAFRVLNDSSHESLAIACRSTGMKRSIFARMLSGFSDRATDSENIERILGLYERLPRPSAERAMRFWRLRAADLGEGLPPLLEKPGDTEPADAPPSLARGSA